MKKFWMLGLLVVYCHISNAQAAEEFAPTDRTTGTTKNISLEARMDKQELELKSLKKDNELLKKELNRLKSSLPAAKRKLTVSRVGSKQVVGE